PRRRPRARVWSGIAAAVVAIAVVAVGATVLPTLFGGASTPPQPSASETPEPVDVVGGIVAPPTDIVGVEKDGEVAFTWTNPDPHDGDVYAWRLQVLGEQARFERVDETAVTVPVQDGRTCVDVMVVRAGGRFSDEATGCAP
ncbi:MAG: serine/threonine protein kinase, partial [Microbacterium sp.]